MPGCALAPKKGRFTGSRTSRNSFVWNAEIHFNDSLKLVMAQSGGIFEATRFASPCEVSRQALQTTRRTVAGWCAD